MGNDETRHDAGYENYSKTSASYDLSRVPVGLSIILDVLAEGAIAPEHARVLDAGCGTGNYLEALSTRVSSLTGLELNPGMLQRAREKLGHRANVALHEGSVLSMPFADASFDAVLLNQVIHHLDAPADAAGDAPTSTWPNLVRALAESHRVLCPGGVLIINTCTQQQVEHGSWYNALVPAAVARLARRYPPAEALVRLLSRAGFVPRESRIPKEIFGGQRYWDPAGPFDESWRNGDSLWALATDAELEAALETLRQLHARGEAAAFVHEQDRRREAGGQSVTIPAWRL